MMMAAVLVVNVGCDQLSKGIVRREVDYHETISVIGSHLILTKVENTGAFLSLGHALPNPLKWVLLIVFPVVALGGAMLYLAATKSLSRYAVLGISFIIGGGIGNLYDRVIHGSVTDFLHIDLGIVRTGIFNMADVSIMTGLVIVLFETFLYRNTEGHA